MENHDEGRASQRLRTTEIKDTEGNTSSDSGIGLASNRRPQEVRKGKIRGVQLLKTNKYPIQKHL